MRYTWIPVLMLVAGCARGPHPPEQPAAADAAFQRLADEFVAGFFAWRPQLGTSLGLHLYDGQITDASHESIQGELARLKSFEQRLSHLDGKRLGPQAFYDYRILRGAIQREIFAFEEMRAYSHNPMTYAGALDLNLYIKRDFAPLEERVKSMVSILRQAPNITAAARANLAESLPRPQTALAIDEANGVADFLAKDLVEAVKTATNEVLMAQFKTANARAIEELRAFAGFLKEQKLPRANEDYALGRAKYRRLLACGEMITQTPEELLSIGLAELHRKQQAFIDAAREIDPAKKPIDVFHAVQKDHPTPESLIPDTARDLEMIRQFVVDRRIVTIPSPVRAQVKETPQFLRATAFATMDTPGPFEPSAKEAYYYVTPPEADWTPQQIEEWLTAFNYYTTDIVSIHEAYPGHYVQYLCLNASPATALEKIFVSYAFSEGWAHYAEQMLVDNGFGRNGGVAPGDRIRAAKFRLAQIDEALLRVCRLCASIKIHCQGMTVEEATRFFQENCYYQEKPARQEAIRGAYDPEYLYYTLGKLEIFKLRADYQQQEGAAFSLQKFHDELLRHGSPPIRLLREVMLKNRSLWDQAL